MLGVREAHHLKHFLRSCLDVGLGETDAAFEFLDKTYQERHGILTYVKVEAAFDRIRSDPRFADLLGRMGLSASK